MSLPVQFKIDFTREVLIIGVYTTLVWFTASPTPTIWFCALGWLSGHLMVAFINR